MLRERCPKCQGAQFLDLDERHGFHARKCTNGHTNGYVDLEGKETPIRVTNGRRADSQEPILSTREYVLEVLGEALLKDVEQLDEGTYGSW